MGHKVQNSKNENHEIIDVIFGNLPSWKEIKFIFRTHKKMGRVRKQRSKIISKINVERYLFFFFYDLGSLAVLSFAINKASWKK